MTFPTVPSRIVLSAIAASWLGLLIHNVADLGSDVLVGPETLGPTMVYLLLTAGLFTAARRLVRWLLLGWAWLTLIEDYSAWCRFRSGPTSQNSP
jgi:hypothetical protein